MPATTHCLEGRVILVTGAGRGIGREVALLAAAEGAKVVVNDLGGPADGIGVDGSVADQVVAEICARGGEAVSSHDSVASAGGAERIVRDLEFPFARSRMMAAAPTGSADGITGQILGIRKNEVYLFSQPRPVRTVHRDGGWTPQALAAHMRPALAPSFSALERSADVFAWEPI